MRHSEILNEQLQTALDSRVIIEQAKGKLAERLGVDMNQAFSLLRDFARSRNLRLSDLARAFVDGTEPLTSLTASRPQQRLPGIRQVPRLQPLDRTSTTDFYELCVERHQRAATIVTSNRTPDEWLTMMADPLLAQSAVDRPVSTAHELVIEGPSYRQRQKPSINGHPAGVSVDDEKGTPHDHS
jgi:ANTAR domain/IstB-like ATP binding protein